MNKLALALALLLAPTMVFGAADSRLYTSVKCSFDMDGDGIKGEATDDCNVCDGAAANSGQNQIYFDCDTGNDTSGLGTSAAPYQTLSKANSVAMTASIICGYGVCDGTEAPSAQAHQGGNASTYTVAARGNEVRSFEYPQQPAMIVGWDKDNDGCYPPFDNGSATAISAGCSATQDTLVFDGGNVQTNFLRNTNEVGYFEPAHFVVANYVGTSSGQFYVLSPSSTVGTDHYYFHDIELANINKNTLGGITGFSFMGGKDTDYFAVENMKCTDCGGTFMWFRGFFENDPTALSSFFRFKNIESNLGLINATTTGVSWSDLGGAITDVEVLDSFHDCELDENTRQCTGFHFGHCASGIDIINVECVDSSACVSLEVDESAAAVKHCAGLARPMDDVVIDRWITRVPNSNFLGKAKFGIEIQAGSSVTNADSNPYETVKNLTIKNGLCIAPSPGVSSCIYLDGSHMGPPGEEVGGVWKVYNNTLIGLVDTSPTPKCEGLICILAENTSGPTDVRVSNNLVQTTETTDLAVDVQNTADITTWPGVNNVYTSGARFKWKTNAAQAVLATWQTQSGGDANAKLCSAQFLETGTTTFPVTSGAIDTDDTCASTAGAPLQADVPIDIEETTRTVPLSAGYFERNSVACAVNADCNDSNPCTDDSCDSLACVFTADGANTCDDGDLCTGAEDCSVAGVCSSAGNPCTAHLLDGDTDCSERCEPTTGACTAIDTPSGSVCNDAITCTSSDTCTSAGVCVGISNCLPTENCEPTSGICESTTGGTVLPGDPVRGPGYIPDGGTEGKRVRVSQLPSCQGLGREFTVTDGAFHGDCAQGGGSHRTKCIDQTPALGCWRPANFGDLAFDSLGRAKFTDTWLNDTPQSFTPSDATPSVAGGNLFQTANAVATTITTFDDMPVGQSIAVRIPDNVTTIQFSNANFVGHGELDWLAASGDLLTCHKFTDTIVCTTTAGGSALVTGATPLSSSGWITAADNNPTLSNAPTGPYVIDSVVTHTIVGWTGSGTCSAPTFDVGTTDTQDLFLNDQGALQTDESKTRHDVADGTIAAAFGKFQPAAAPLRARVQSCATPTAGATLVVVTYHLVDAQPTGSVANLAATSYIAAGSCELAYTYEGEVANGAAVNSGSLGAICNGNDSQSADVDDVARETAAPLNGNTSADFKEMGSSNNDYFQITDATCIASLTSESLTDKTWMTLFRPTQVGVLQTWTGDYSGSNFTGFAGTIGSNNKFGARVGHSAVGSPTSTLRESTTVLSAATTYHLAAVYRHTSPTLAVYVNCALEGSGATSGTQQMSKAAAPPTSFAAVSVSGSSEVGAKLDNTMICNDELTALEIAYVASCGPAGEYCACDGSTPANYATCATNADCTVGAATAVCNTTALTCSGYQQTQCAGATLPACNHTAP